MAVKNFSLRIEEDMLCKLHAVAEYEGRSANSQLNILIRECIRNFEAEHGTIETDKK